VALGRPEGQWLEQALAALPDDARQERGLIVIDSASLLPPEQALARLDGVRLDLGALGYDGHRLRARTAAVPRELPAPPPGPCRAAGAGRAQRRPRAAALKQRWLCRFA
jgi:hypothetical protein